jgi:hypothetical protein
MSAAIETVNSERPLLKFKTIFVGTSGEDTCFKFASKQRWAAEYAIRAAPCSIQFLEENSPSRSALTQAQVLRARRPISGPGFLVLRWGALSD